MCYGLIVWTMNPKLRPENNTALDYLRRRSKIVRLKMRRNEEIRESMDARETGTDRIERKGFKLFWTSVQLSMSKENLQMKTSQKKEKSKASMLLE